MANTISTKIKIEGEKEYKSSIKNITQETKTLDAQLKEVASRFDDETESMEKAKESAELLQKKKEALERELETMQNHLDDVKEAYGDNSMEAMKLEEQIAKVETQLNNTNSAIETNEEVLQGASDAATETSTSFEGMGEAGDIAGAMLGSSFTNMGNIIANVDLVSLASTAAGAIRDIGQAAYDAYVGYEESMGNIATATGLYGEELNNFTNSTNNLWASFSDADLTLDETTSMVGALNTRFSIGSDQVETWGNTVLRFAQETGVDATDAVNGIADAMRQWGMDTDNSSESLYNMSGIMDMLLVASQNCDVNLGTLTSAIIDNAGAADAMGMTMEELVTLLVAYEDAGGDASDMSAAIQKSYQNLNGAVQEYNATHEDSQITVEECWDSIINTLENAEDMDEALNTTVGDLGVTLEDVMGKRQAQQIANTFTTGGASIQKFSTNIENSRGSCARLQSSVITLTDSIDQMGKSAERSLFYYTALDQANATRNQTTKYAKAVSQPYLFTGEQTITVAETQPEVLVGKNYFDNLVAGAQTTNNYGGATVNVYGTSSQDVTELARLVSDEINRETAMQRRAR